MTRVTQPFNGRGKMLPAALMAAALFALLAFVPLASAASDPIGSGTTTVTLNKGFFKKLKKNGIKVLKVSPTTVKSRTVTLVVSAGSIDPLTGQGTVEHSGGIKLKAGKKTAALKSLVLDTTKGSLSGKVANKSMKIASVSGLTVTREGFGAKVSIGKLMLTGKAASTLNKKLGFSGQSKKKNGKKSKRASVSKAAQKPFKGNQLLGSSATAEQPKTVVVQPTGNATLVLDPAALKKLKHVGTPPYPEGSSPVEVKLSPVEPTQVTSLSPVTVAFPFSEGGTIAPDASGGILHTAGGLKLVQNLEAVTMEPGNVTTLTMGNIWVDMGAKTATVEVTIENPKNSKANLGNLGRVSIANLNLAGATITSDPAAHTVTVQNATATLQDVTAATLNQVFIEGLEQANPLFKGQEKFAGGDLLGSFSFTAQTQ